MVGTAFGVSDDDIRATQVFEHQRTDVAGMGAFFGKMDVLRAEGNLGSAQGFLTEASSVNGGQTRNSQSDLPNALTS